LTFYTKKSIKLSHRIYYGVQSYLQRLPNFTFKTYKNTFSLFFTHTFSEFTFVSHPPSASRRPPPAARRPPSAIRRPPSTIDRIKV
jgi:hypothetical protein